MNVRGSDFRFRGHDHDCKPGHKH